MNALNEVIVVLTCCKVMYLLYIDRNFSAYVVVVTGLIVVQEMCGQVSTNYYLLPSLTTGLPLLTVVICLLLVGSIVQIVIHWL